MLTTLIISGCSVTYELIISAVSSYLLGNSTLQYSLTIGLYMSALGFGSYLSRFFRKNLYNTLIKIELGIGIIGGLSSLILFLANLYIESYSVVMFILILVIGGFAGAEIPILTRIIEEEQRDLKLTLSSIFSFDYIGGLIGSIAFPLLLLPYLGYIGASFLCGFLNVGCAILILIKYRERIKLSGVYQAAALLVALCMVWGMIWANNLSAMIEGGLYRDQVIYSKQTKYQKIVMTKHKDDTRLFIDGNCQFSSADEYRYHEALVHIPMSKIENPQSVLILGGGDGLALREVLKYDVREVDLVDLDEEMVKVSKTNPHIRQINQDSLQSDKLTVHHIDAYEYLETNQKQYDCIIVDLPDPNSEVLNKLYSNVFYRLCKNSLSEDGLMVVQSTSPYYAKKAFWSINKTIASEGLEVKPYHLEVPAFGDWGFNMASRRKLDDHFTFQVETKFLSEENVAALFMFGKDERTDEVEINQLTRPVLMHYYNDAIKEWN